VRQRYSVRAYWAARRESIEQCADRLLEFFADLTTSDPSLAVWYEKGMSREEALEKRAATNDRNYLLRLLDRGRNRRDFNHTIIKNLGFSLGLWNGGEEGQVAGLRIHCGQYSQNFDNNVLLELPEDLGGLRQSKRTAGLLGSIARAWEPDWAGVMSDEAIESRNFRGDGLFVDWMVYVPNTVTGLVPPSTVVDLPDLGSVVIVQDTPPREGNSEDLARIQRVQEIIQNTHAEPQSSRP